MNKNAVLKLSILIGGILITPISHAYDNSTHILGANIGGVGSQSFDTSAGEDADYQISNMSMSGDIYYRYMLNPHFGVEAGFMGGGGGGVLNWLGLSDVRNFHYLAGRTALYANLPFLWGNSIYGKIGGTAIRVGYEIDDIERRSTEYGLYSAIGWEYRFNSGFGLNLEYQYISADKFETESYHFGASYAF
ncbi:outer membrane beta-barrel protein [Photobacterium nomapromontoriensis]|uniref:outer membrane beta-barrel protein n=1 Tax=Photobacterium nomapromontoriensis TaxID=2910237 RepID=UPI003D097BBB